MKLVNQAWGEAQVSQGKTSKLFAYYSKSTDRSLDMDFSVSMTAFFFYFVVKKKNYNIANYKKSFVNVV